MRCAKERETAHSSGPPGCQLTHTVPRSLRGAGVLSVHRHSVLPDTEREVAVSGGGGGERGGGGGGGGRGGGERGRGKMIVVSELRPLLRYKNPAGNSYVHTCILCTCVFVHYKFNSETHTNMKQHKTMYFPGVIPKKWAASSETVYSRQILYQLSY